MVPGDLFDDHLGEREYTVCRFEFDNRFGVVFFDEFPLQGRPILEVDNVDNTLFDALLWTRPASRRWKWESLYCGRGGGPLSRLGQDNAADRGSGDIQLAVWCFDRQAVLTKVCQCPDDDGAIVQMNMRWVR